MAGPARDFSKPNSREFRAQGRPASVLLPAVNELPTPPAPAGVTFTAPEAESWADLWATGESTMWTDASLTPVAVLVRLTSRIFDGEASTAEVAQADRLMAALGLTPAARSRLGWEVSS